MPTSAASRSASAPVDGVGYDFRGRGRSARRVLDHAFTELERDERRAGARRAPGPGRRAGSSLWVDEAYGYLQLFTGDPLPDVARRSLAVEPMTCPPNAFRTGEALVRLEPGASWTGAWGIAAA